MRPARRRRARALALVVTALVLVGAANASALFTSTTSGGAAVGTGVLEPVTDLVDASTDCGSASRAVRVGWTPSPSAFRQGHRVVVTGATSTTLDLGATATSATVPGPSPAGVYTVSVTARYRNWTSTTPSVTFRCGATAPGAPAQLTATAGDGRVTASWTAPADTGGSPVTGYTVTAVLDGAGAPTRTCTATTTTCDVTGLVNGATYTLTVTATSAGGTGPASAARTAVPYPSTILTGTAARVWLDAQHTSSLHADPAGTAAATSGGAVQRWAHRLGTGWDAVKPGAAGSPTLQPAAINGRPAVRFDRTHPDYLEITDPGIGAVGSADRTMFVVAQARTTADADTNGYGTLAVWPGRHSGLLGVGHPAVTALGAGGWATPSQQVTVPDQPVSGAFLASQVASSAGGSVTLRLAVDGGGGASGSRSSAWQSYPDLLRIGAGNVAPLTQYQGNLDGDIGELIVLDHAVTESERRTVEEYLARKWSQVIAPSAPLAVSAARASSTSATVTWGPPASTGGAPVTGYTATAAPGGQSCTSTGTSCTIPGLPAGTTATITVTATNSAGTGPASAGVAHSASVQVPDAPTAVTAAPGDGQVVVAWTAPDDGGAGITSYTATAAGSPTRTCTSTTTSCTVTGLTDGVTYAVTVTATNAVGTGPASAAATAVPYPATILSPARTRLWLDGADPGAFSQDAAGATAATAAGQPVGRWRDRSGRANHATQGTGAARPALSTVAGRLVPTFDGTDDLLSMDPALLPTAGDPSTAFVATTLTGPASTSPTLLFWGARTAAGQGRSTFVDGASALCTDAFGTAGACAAGTVTAGTPFLATSVFSAGTIATARSGGPTATVGQAVTTGSAVASLSPASNRWQGPVPEVIVLDAALTAAERRQVEEYLARKWATVITAQAPASVTATAGAGQVAVSWTAPAWDGGAAVSGYTATAAPGGQSCTTTGATTCTITGLTGGTAHTISVTAANSAGTGPARIATATPTTQLTAPGAPTAVTGSSPVTVSTLAGSTAGSANGTGTTAQFNQPHGVAVAGDGTVYVADRTNGSVRAVTPGGVVTTLATGLQQPGGVAVHSDGTVYVAETGAHRIRAVTPAGAVSTVAGSGFAGAGDGPDLLAGFNLPTGIAVTADKTLYVADNGSNRIRRITPGLLGGHTVTTLAGSGTAGSTDDTGTAATFNRPTHLALEPSGSLVVADTNGNRIRRVTTSGAVTTVAGSATASSVDGPVASATFNAPRGVAVDGSGTIYVADLSNRVRRITTGGTVSTVAGTGASGAADGPSGSAAFNQVQGLAATTGGDVHVADAGNHRIRSVAGMRRLAVSWAAPASNGGAAITGYTATATPGGATCSTTGATTCTIGDLVPGTSYTVTVRATTSAGTGAASAPSGPVTVS